jgi:hypothetical protein
MSNFFLNKISRLIIAASAVLFFLSCQKDLSLQTGPDAPGTIPDLAAKVTSSVSGFVTDENDAPVINASVAAGETTVLTDKYGFFEIKNVHVVKTAAVVSVINAGYFKGIKTYMAENNKAVFLRIKLIPKTNSGNVNAASGGNVTLPNGMIVALPAAGVVKASDNSPYTGTVNIAAHWIDPVSADISQTMPGDLRGINTDGYIKRLTTYGMAAVELTSTSGELLQVAPGKKATLTFPIPASLAGTAPASIPLWSFDETNGLWKQEGQATKTGNNYVGEVSHFSFWNCDVPNNYVQFNCTVKDEAGNPIPGIIAKISVVGTIDSRYGYTDSSGYVSGAVPDNAQLKLELFSYYACNSAVYSQNFTTTNADISLGVITVNSNLSVATVTGTVTDCFGNPVAPGRIIILNNNQYYNFGYALSNTGSFSFTTMLCNNSSTVTIVAEDMTSMQQSAPITVTLVTGPNAIGNIQACGISTQEFISYSIDGGAPITLSAPADSVVQYGNGTSTSDYIAGSQASGGGNVSFIYANSGIGAGSTQQILEFYSSVINSQPSVVPPANVNITEYGNVGEFIAGNFDITLTSTSPPTTYAISCHFRVRRNF